MVEVTQEASRFESTPESEKPRVQLELKSKTNSSPSVGKLKQNTGDEHLDLLKQTVASLGHPADGGEQAPASTVPSAATE